MTYKVGDKIKFQSEKRSYKIMALDSRYLICVKRFNLLHTYLYTIVDLQEQQRGPVSLNFGLSLNMFEHDECEILLRELKSGAVGLSYRRSIPLDLVDA